MSAQPTNSKWGKGIFLALHLSRSLDFESKASWNSEINFRTPKEEGKNFIAAANSRLADQQEEETKKVKYQILCTKRSRRIEPQMERLAESHR